MLQVIYGKLTKKLKPFKNTGDKHFFVCNRKINALQITKSQMIGLSLPKLRDGTISGPCTQFCVFGYLWVNVYYQKTANCFSVTEFCLINIFFFWGTVKRQYSEMLCFSSCFTCAKII